MKQGSVGKNAVEKFCREFETKKVLVPDRATAVFAR